MDLESLRVIHLPKKAEASGVSVAPIDALCGGAFRLESCQRWLWLVDSAVAGELALPALPGLQEFSGADAYELLLRVASGLESEVVGETDIFGQLKEAWKKFEATGSRQVPGLSHWIQKAFEDTKEIRTRWLQSVGGDSYGSLVRRILRETADAGSGPVLVVGAGKIAQSVAPWLCESELWVLNRSAVNGEALVRALSERAEGPVRAIPASEADRAWREARHVVVCIPVDAESDRARIAAWLDGARAGLAKGLVVHLGGYGRDCEGWISGIGAAAFRSLDDLFRLKEDLSDARRTSIAQAGKACRERAQLRALGGSVTLPHGWEDLAVFAS